MQKEQILQVLVKMIDTKLKDKSYYNQNQYEESTLNLDADLIYEALGNETVQDEYTFIREEEVGGYEGAGENTHYVFSLIDNRTEVKTSFKISGYYNSWDSTEWYSFDIVEPKEITVMQWVKQDLNNKNTKGKNI